MSIMPEGEALRSAVKWISDERQYNPEKPVGKLINEAGIRFDLDPNETGYLIRFYQKKDSPPTS